MAQDTEPARIGPPTFDPPAPAAVLAWGDSGADVPPRYAVAARIIGDRRLVAVVAALGGIALFASLISVWQITVIELPDLGAGTEHRQFFANVADLAGWSSGYLVGMFLLAGAMALVLVGPSTVRAGAALTALSTGGVLLAMLVAILADLRVHSKFSNVLELSPSQDQFQVTYGRGIWCALVGVAATTVAAYLAGRQLAQAPPAPVPAFEAPAATTDTPLDLSVTPTAPFTVRADEFDMPTDGYEPPR